MKAHQFLMYFILVNGMFSMFLRIGIFSQAAALGVSEATWSATPQALIGLSGWSGIGALGLGALTMAVMAKSGVNPFLAMAYSAVVGIFVGTYTATFAMMYSVANTFQEYSGIFIGLIIIISTVYAFSVLWGMIQMATGGGKGYDD